MVSVCMLGRLLPCSDYRTVKNTRNETRKDRITREYPTNAVRFARTETRAANYARGKASTLTLHRKLTHDGGPMDKTPRHPGSFRLRLGFLVAAALAVLAGLGVGAVAAADNPQVLR